MSDKSEGKGDKMSPEGYGDSNGEPLLFSSHYTP